MWVLAPGKQATQEMKNYPNHRWQDVHHPGRIYKEWFRLKPEYGEQLHLTRADISDGRTFFDTIQVFVNWRVWQGWTLKINRHTYAMVGLPFWYKAKYDYHDMGQHRFEFEFRFLNVVYLQWHRNRDLDDKVALRFKRRYGKDVHPYAAVQTQGR